MSAFPIASQGVDELLSPMDAGEYIGTATASGVAAANLDLNSVASFVGVVPAGSAAADMAKGSRWVSLQARGGDIFIRFKTTATAAATTSGTGSNGLKIPQDQTVHFYVDPVNRQFVDHIASVAGCTLFWWFSSPNYNQRQPR